jgi:hypothetical protein
VPKRNELETALTARSHVPVTARLSITPPPAPVTADRAQRPAASQA